MHLTLIQGIFKECRVDLIIIAVLNPRFKKSVKAPGVQFIDYQEEAEDEEMKYGNEIRQTGL